MFPLSVFPLSVDKTGESSFIINNLDFAIDNNTLQDAFASFDGILSSKAAQDEDGNSRSYLQLRSIGDWQGCP